jgi:CRP-like cAMP-binding protein
MLETLPALPTLESLTASDRELIGHRANRVFFHAGNVLIQEMEPLHRLYVVLEGKVRIEVRGQVLVTLGAGAVCGEMAFLEGKPASASVVAVGEVVAEEITAPDLRGLFDMFPSLGMRFYKSLALTLSRKLRDTSAELAAARAAAR